MVRTCGSTARSAWRRGNPVARFAAARLTRAAHPHVTRIEPRFQDLDPLGHINNVAMAGLCEDARVRFNRAHLHVPGHRESGERWLIARVELNYLAEAHYPDPIDVATGIGTIGTRSWTILSTAFQGDVPVAIVDATLVLTGPDGSRPIRDGFRATLETLRVAD